MVIGPRSNYVPECAEQHGKAPDQTRPIHVFRGNCLGWGPEGEEEGNDSVHEADNIGDYAEAT